MNGIVRQEEKATDPATEATQRGTKFMKVTQPWQDELADLVQKVETKLAKFREIEATVGKLFAEQVIEESLDQA